MKQKSIKSYLNMFGDIPKFLKPYLDLSILKRLKKVGYFCGMDYASKEIYFFKYKISRFDHSLSTALMTWKYSHDKKQTIAALFHDISTPCFSHVIDYMNKDYETQESTEELTEHILRKSKKLVSLLKEDNLTIEDITNFKILPIVDNHRPRLCADRIDGIILTSLSWTKTLSIKEIPSILDSIKVYKNEDNLDELGFNDDTIAKRIYNLNTEIDIYCHSKEDNYMMELLASITRYSINKEYINYNNLYEYTEEYLLEYLSTIEDTELHRLLNLFKTATLEDVSINEIPSIKVREINPLVNGERLLK